MTYPGTDLKFRITAAIEGFSLADNYFTIAVKNGYGRLMYRRTKNQCFRDTEGSWYFTLTDIVPGTYTAVFTAYLPDDDFLRLIRRETDVQMLYDTHADRTDPAADSHRVQYERVYTASVGDEQFLVDENGDYIMSSDGQRVRFLPTDGASGHVDLQMTGQQFRQLIEGTNPNGIIDTVPEALSAIGSMGDQTQYGVMTNGDADEMMGRVLGEGE